MDSFFNAKSARSEAKARIVAKYFHAWAQVVRRAAKLHSEGRLAYIDLFAGPGRYLDSSKSTPLLILEDAVKDADLSQMLISIFNDIDRGNTHSLSKAIETIPGIGNLKNQPAIYTDEVGEHIVAMFEKMSLVPTFFFIDPWGYKGLSLRLVNSVLRNWGSDCVFFFNYNRIQMGLTNPKVKYHMDQLFGVQRADALRAEIANEDPKVREKIILTTLTDALKEMGGKFVQPFCFKTDDATRTSHYLVFVTKDFKGYEIMKPIMAKESTRWAQGVPSFVYDPTEIRSPKLFEISRPLDELQDLLMMEFQDRHLSMRAIYREHSVGKNYIATNYKEALKRLEAKGAIATSPPANKRQKRKGEVTFGDDVEVTFPCGQGG